LTHRTSINLVAANHCLLAVPSRHGRAVPAWFAPEIILAQTDISIDADRRDVRP